jgi:RNA polymerase sigma-70 factor, ECF subfamily
LNAFHELYELHKDDVFRLAMRYVNSVEDAEDIVQEVFVAVYFGLEKFDRRSNVSTWIYRITVNKSLDYLKARKRKKRWGKVISIFGITAQEEFTAGTAAAADKPFLDQEADEALMRAIAELPESQQTALVLARLEGRPQAEVADIMDVSVKAVESLLQRAKRTLSEKISIPGEGTPGNNRPTKTTNHD